MTSLLHTGLVAHTVATMQDVRLAFDLSTLSAETHCDQYVSVQAAPENPVETHHVEDLCKAL